MSVKLLTEHHLELLGLTGGCRGSSESTHVKMPHCWKSHILAHLNMESGAQLVERKTGDRRHASSSLTSCGVTVLCPGARHFIPCLVQVQPRKTIQYD